MDNKLRKWRSKRDFLKLLQYRESNSSAAKFLKQHAQFTDSLVNRLGLEYELQGHNGCVNCLQWTPNGSLLASGSDDTNVILWDPFRHKLLQIIPTTHIGNIFSVKFLGTNSSIIATAAGDCRVLVQTIPISGEKTIPLLECSCHINRVKRLATSPEEPSLFWSAAEDGMVLQFDLREQHECSTSKSQVLLDLTKITALEVKCAAVNPTKPHYIAIGANDCYVRVYDRRMIKTTPITQTGNDRPKSDLACDVNCAQYYAPGHLAYENASTTNFRLAATYVSFNAAGSEMLVNMGGEQIYLFDVNNKRHIDEIRVPQCGTVKKEHVAFKCSCPPEGNGFVSNGIHRMDYETCHFNEDCACFYMRRAYKYYRRNWMSDTYSAARDYLFVTKNWPDQRQAYVGLIRCLISLKWLDEAQQWIDYFCHLFPDFSNCSQLKVLKDNLNVVKNAPKESEDSDIKDYFIKKIDEIETNRRLQSVDYEVRFLGHCNTTTDIKEANFLGEDGNYICAGSDEGIIFVWERKRSSIVTALFGDISIVNCIQPHPTACTLASSGIDPVVKIWSPMPEDGIENSRKINDLRPVVEANQQRMSMDPFESMLVNMGYRIPISSNWRAEENSYPVPVCRTC